MQQIRVIEDNAIEPVGSGRVVEGGDISIPIKQDVEAKPLPIRVIEDNNQNYFQQQESEEQKEERRPKNRRPLKSRPEAVQINRLNQMLHEQQAENERLRQETEHYRMQAAHKDQIATINHENALNVRKETAKSMMKDGMESGDAEKVVEGADILTQAGSQLNELERVKQSYNYEPQYVPPPQSKPQDYYPEEEFYQEDPYAEEAREEVNNAVNEFLIENPWCDPSNGDDYKETKHKKFLYEGKKLAQKYIDQGQRDYLDSKQFLEEVASRMSPYIDKGNTAQRSGSMVSPVNRGNGSYGTNSSKELVMTRAEYDVFSRLPEVMRNKDVNYLAQKYKEAKEDLTRKGKIGRGLQMRPSSMGRY